MARAMTLQLEIGSDIPASTGGLVARALLVVSLVVSTSGLVARVLVRLSDLMTSGLPACGTSTR